MEDAKDGKVFTPDINAAENSTDFEGDTVGTVTTDGTPMILAWNKKCEIPEPGVYEWNNNTNKSASCVAVLMNVNGTKRPDGLGRDIILLNASNFEKAACIEFTINGQTYKRGCPFMPQPLSYMECMALVEEGKISGCTASNYCMYGNYYRFWSAMGGDRRASAVRTCDGKNKMPSEADLTALKTYFTGQDNGVNITSRLCSLNSDLCSEYINYRGTGYGAGKEPYTLGLWSGDESNSLEAGAHYYSSYNHSNSFYHTWRYIDDALGACKAE